MTHFQFPLENRRLELIQVIPYLQDAQAMPSFVPGPLHTSPLTLKIIITPYPVPIEQGASDQSRCRRAQSCAWYCASVLGSGSTRCLMPGFPYSHSQQRLMWGGYTWNPFLVSSGMSSSTISVTVTVLEKQVFSLQKEKSVRFWKIENQPLRPVRRQDTEWKREES